MKKLIFAISLVFLGVGLSPAQTPYFQGKTIRIVTGYPAGGVNYLWPRLIGQSMTKYVRGNPTSIVQNMTGGGGFFGLAMRPLPPFNPDSAVEK